MTEYLKPLPPLEDPLVAHFYAAARARRLEIQACQNCASYRWPPSPTCPECLLPGGVWTEVSGAGRIWSFATYHRAYRPEFTGDLPYSVALVELDAGINMLTNVDAAPNGAIRVGMEVGVVFDDVTSDVTLVKFALDPSRLEGKSDIREVPDVERRARGG